MLSVKSSNVGGMGPRDHVILVLLECICNELAFSLVLLIFDDTGSLGSLPLQMVYPPCSMVNSGCLPPVSLRGIGRLS